MNFLAHLLLAGPDPDLRCGGVLGDFVRGPLQGRFEPGIEAGIALHRHIDAASGRHPAMQAALRRFQPPYRRWAPIALDVLFDHYLASSFEAWHDQPLTEFSQTCYAQLEGRLGIMPAPARRFVGHMRSSDLLGRYIERTTVGRALSQMAGRTRRPNELASIAPVLDAEDAQLRACFEQLLPDLQRDCEAWRRSHG